MAVSAFFKFNQFSEDLAHGVHNFATCQFVLALCAAADAPIAANSVLADLTQISYTNCSTRNVVRVSSAQTASAYKLVLTDHVLTAGAGAIAAFRYVVLYNDTPTSPADPLIGWYDYGADQILGAGESLTVDLDGSAGALHWEWAA